MTKTSLETRIRNLNLATLATDTRDNFVDKHFGLTSDQIVTDSDLIHRAVTTKKNVSAFTVDRETALMLIQEAMYEYMDDIVDWLADNSDGLDLEAYLDCDTTIGKGFYKTCWHSWNAGACNCSVVKVVLRKTNTNAEFRIVTAYPEPSEYDKHECWTAGKKYQEEYPERFGVKGYKKLAL